MPRRDTGAYVSDRRLYLDKDGNVVDAASPDRQTLLVAEGGELPRAKAVEHGLIPAEDDDPARPKAPARAESKHVASPAETKSEPAPKAKAEGEADDPKPKGK